MNSGLASSASRNPASVKPSAMSSSTQVDPKSIFATASDLNSKKRKSTSYTGFSSPSQKSRPNPKRRASARPIRISMKFGRTSGAVSIRWR